MHNNLGYICGTPDQARSVERYPRLGTMLDRVCSAGTPQQLGSGAEAIAKIHRVLPDPVSSIKIPSRAAKHEPRKRPDGTPLVFFKPFKHHTAVPQACIKLPSNSIAIPYLTDLSFPLSQGCTS